MSALTWDEVGVVESTPRRHLTLVPTGDEVATGGLQLTRRGRLAITLVVLALAVIAAVVGVNRAFAAPAAAAPLATVTVASGDTLSAIAAREELNSWRRNYWTSGYEEGWALYAERLMDDLGYLADPADRLGMLDAQSFRAARVIVDIGMHLELEIPADNPFGFHRGERWTPALGLEFMRQHCQMDDAFIRFEVARYLGWPGQAPSYKVGERIWLEARDEAKARHGTDFDLKAFHRAALDLGSIGLDPLRAALARI